MPTCGPSMRLHLRWRAAGVLKANRRSLSITRCKLILTTQRLYNSLAALRLLTSLWRIDPEHARAVAPSLGSDVPACLLSLPMRGEGAGDKLTPVDASEISGAPVLLINPRAALSTADVFANWNGEDHGPLDDWRDGRNDLEKPAIALMPLIGAVEAWLAAQHGAYFTRMSGSGATCFALFDSEEERDAAADRVPREWWKLATFLR